MSKHDFQGAARLGCDVSRRAFVSNLARGLLGVTAGGMIGSRLGAQALGQPLLTLAPRHQPAQQVIYLFLRGGMSHLDTLDPKPGAATQGPTEAIKTRADGVQLSQHFPLLAEQMDKAEWQAFRDRIAESARIGSEEYGLTVGIHAHAAGFMDFEPELERLLDEVDDKILKICFDTGHHSYAGFDPVAFMKKHIGRISYMHFKDIDPEVKARVIENRTGFYEACGQGIFCNLGEGDVDFPAVRQVLLDAGFEGWCTVEQDCDPTLDPDPLGDARANREYLESIGFK